MQNIIICGYRDWSYKVFCNVNEVVHEKCIYIDDKHFLNKEIVEQINPKYIFFIGWSWIVEDYLIDNYSCICLHPSPLPKYRGGSPIQHQIINGETESAVTLFNMDHGIDTGDILSQINFSLLGDLKDIYERMTQIGTDCVVNIIENGFESVIKQDENNASYFKRRTPEMSEIEIEDFSNYTAIDLHNKVRSLQTPYPNAFIRCKDGSKLFLQKTKVES